MEKEPFNVTDLRAGIGVIANVMLLGQFTSDEGPIKPTYQELYMSLCEMTQSYADCLLENSEAYKLTAQENERKAEKFNKVINSEKKLEIYRQKLRERHPDELPRTC